MTVGVDRILIGQSIVGIFMCGASVGDENSPKSPNFLSLIQTLRFV